MTQDEAARVIDNTACCFSDNIVLVALAVAAIGLIILTTWLISRGIENLQDRRAISKGNKFIREQMARDFKLIFDDFTRRQNKIESRPWCDYCLNKGAYIYVEHSKQEEVDEFSEFELTVKYCPNCGRKI